MSRMIAADLCQRVPAHLIVMGLVGIARHGAPRWGVGPTVALANRVARLVHRKGKLERPFGDVLELGRICALRANRVVAGANCLHRAFALRIWYAHQGIETRIVIGFRKREALEGHAWIEIPDSEGEAIRIFCTDADGYREVADEDLILAHMRFQ